MSNWTLLSNHGHVLVCLSRDPEARLRDVAADVGITERAVQKIVRDLQDGGMLSITKSGRRNRYRIHKRTNLRHTLEAHCTLGELTSVLTRAGGDENPPEPATKAENKPDRKTQPPEQAKTEQSEPRAKPAKPAISRQPDSIERQQGSLF